MWKLSKRINGKWVVDSIDTLPVINARKKALAASYRGKNVLLKVEETEEEEKYRKPLSDQSWRGGDYSKKKSKVKANKKFCKRKNRNQSS